MFSRRSRRGASGGGQPLSPPPLPTARSDSSISTNHATARMADSARSDRPAATRRATGSTNSVSGPTTKWVVAVGRAVAHDRQHDPEQRLEADQRRHRDCERQQSRMDRAAAQPVMDCPDGPAERQQDDEQRDRAMQGEDRASLPARRSAGQCEQALASPALSAVWKLWPQPQVFTALGLLMVKPPPMMAST